MSFIDRFQIGFDRNIHPPSVAFLAFVEYDLILVVFNGNSVFDKIFCILAGKFIAAVIKPVDKMPYHLSNQMGSLVIVIVFRICFIKSKRGELVAETGISYDLADLLAIKSVWG